MVARALLILFSFSIAASSECIRMGYMTHTFFGYPDNDPPGPATAYNCGGRNYVAGGTGTYADPLTFASAPGEFDQCEIIYDPYLRKYLRHEDYCAQCTTDWNNGQVRHIDVWTGSSTFNGGQKQIDCENALTPAQKSQTIVRKPATNLPVDFTVLFANGQCRTSHVYPSYNIKSYCCHAGEAC